MGIEALRTSGTVVAPQFGATGIVRPTRSSAQRPPGGPTLQPDQVSISNTARQQLASDSASAQDLSIQSKTVETTGTPKLPPQSEGRSADRRIQPELSGEQIRQLVRLRARDVDVRAHEQAHIRAAGPFISGPATFTFVRGPDGRQFAVAGSVAINTAPIPGDPEATVRKEAQVERAALAPRDPSAQDRRVAAQAKAARLQAQHQLQALQREQRSMSERTQLNRSETGAATDTMAAPELDSNLIDRFA